MAKGADAFWKCRYGSEADMNPLISDVSFTPKSGHQAAGLQCPLWANNSGSRIGDKVRVRRQVGPGGSRYYIVR